MRTMKCSPIVGACAASVMLVGAAHADSPAQPYVLAVPGAGVQHIVPMLTVGEGVGSYRFVGIPDGLGMYNTYATDRTAAAAGQGTFRLFCNQELNQAQGVARAHGGTGAFVSQWDFGFAPNGTSLTFTTLAGQDAIQSVQEYNDATGQYVAAPNGRFHRFCSAYLAGRWSGFSNYVFMTGEETTDSQTYDGRSGGQSFAVINGIAYAVPRMGRVGHENQVVLRGTGNKTVVMNLDDSTVAEMYIYVGTKQKVGPNVLAPNGLHNGNLYTLVTSTITHESQLIKGQPVPFTLAQVDWTLQASPLKAQAQGLGATDFVRIEDGAYDLNNPNVFYFVTTGNPGGLNPNGKLHKIVFNDVTNPTAGGTIEVLLDGSEGMISPDNIDINYAGQLLLCEDPNFAPPGTRDSSIWAYNVNTTDFSRIAEMNTGVAFTLHGPSYTRGSWETSGIIDASHILGEGWWLFDVQAHYNLADPELVQGGQLLAMKWLPPTP